MEEQGLLRFLNMHGHWDKFLKVKDLVKKAKPELVVELGAGGGDNTDQYLELRKSLPFKMIVISDGECPERFKNIPDFVWIFGISYKELGNTKLPFIDFCSIDTDHNYWTLKQELKCLNNCMRKGGIVVLHDTESYRHNSGVMMNYKADVPYPKEILENQKRGMVEALEEEIKAGNYEIIKETKKSCGAIAIKRL